MLPRAAAAAALALVVGGTARGTPARTARALEPLEPARVIRAPANAGLYDGAFALGAEGRRLAVIRGDGDRLAKLELFDTSTGAVVTAHDLPAPLPPLERLELLPGDAGVLLVTRDQGPRPLDPDEPARLSAMLIDGSGRVAARLGPAAAFGVPARAPVLIAFDRHPAGGGATTYSIAAFQLPALAPAGKPRLYRAGPAGDIPSPAFRILGFFDGYARAVGETPAGKAAVLDALAGKLGDETAIRDALDWARAAALRADHPGEGRFAALNPDQAGVDIVDVMGDRQPAVLAAPLDVYEAKSLRSQEGPEPGAFHFSLAVDTLNAAAVKRRKPDLPMLDVYAGPKLAGRVFVPRPVTWTASWGKLVVLKRLRNARGGDELQIYDLR